MVDYPSRNAVSFATLAGMTGVAGSYMAAGYTREFLVAPIDDLVVGTTPGLIVAWMIENVGEQGHLLHIAPSFVIAIGLLAGTAIVGLHIARGFERPVIGVGLSGVLAWSLTALITAEPLLAVGAAGPVTVLTAVGATPLAAPEHDPSRRRALISSVSALAFIGTAIGFRQLTADDDTAGGEPLDETTDDGIATLMQEAESKSLDIRGDVPGLVSTFEEFYTEIQRECLGA